MPLTEPSHEQVERFARDLASLAPEFDRLGLAVSGGPDSLGLLLLAHATFPGRVAAATVDHGLRPESASEARFVADLCASLGVPHALLTAQVDVTRASLQRAARVARYDALEAWMRSERLRLLATAHHIDDQAETLLMRLLRGSGVAGLAGVRARTAFPGSRGDLMLIRPLLEWRRSELRTLVEAAGIAPIEDPSNQDPRFDRTQMRARLSEAEWIEAGALARSASALADADEALRWVASEIFETRVQERGDQLCFAHRGLPRELKRRTLLAILAAFEPAATPRGQDMDRLLAALERGEIATLAGVKCSGGAEWSFTRAAPRRGGR